MAPSSATGRSQRLRPRPLFHHSRRQFDKADVAKLTIG
jgi:hypothetical protein